MSFCDKCTEHAVIPGTPEGKIVNIAGTDCYVAEPATDAKKAGAVAYLPDVFGLATPNAKIMADRIAKETGRKVVVVDYFKGDPLPESAMKHKSHTSDTITDEEKTENLKNIMAWFGKGHSPDVAWGLTEPVLKELKKEGKVGATGYCYGGKIAFLASNAGLADAIAFNHPSLLEPAEADKLSTPVLFNMAEEDDAFSEEKKDAFLKAAKEKGLYSDLSKTYEGAVHGFACRPDLSKPQIKDAYEGSISALISFFNKTLA